MSAETDRHFKQLSDLSVPAKRAAYSDRMAWIMSLLASIVYERFDAESDDIIMKVATDLAKSTQQKKIDAVEIAKKLRKLASELTSIGRQTETAGNTVLKATLDAGGFDLVGGAPIHTVETDTQAMVIVRRATDTEPPFAVLCFRGTQQTHDWITNLKTDPQPITSPKPGGEIIGNMHTGFHEAFKSVESEIRERLEADAVKGLPLYVTGHSLGGALAVVATWYLSSNTLAACYTFGAPRVGDAGLLGWFKTPIYRIVNFADPVPFTPPSGTFVAVLKHVFRFIAIFVSIGGFFDNVVDFLIKQQGFRHYGDMKYLPFSKKTNGEYPGNFRIQPGISNISRLYRYARVFFTRKAKTKPDVKFDRIDLYHGMDQYREKLRAVALNRNT